jgi:hypothetical protein
LICPDQSATAVVVTSILTSARGRLLAPIWHTKGSGILGYQQGKTGQPVSVLSPSVLHALCDPFLFAA